MRLSTPGAWMSAGARGGPARRPLSRRRPYSSFLRLVNPPRNSIAIVLPPRVLRASLAARVKDESAGHIERCPIPNPPRRHPKPDPPAPGFAARLHSFVAARVGLPPYDLAEGTPLALPAFDDNGLAGVRVGDAGLWHDGVRRHAGGMRQAWPGPRGKLRNALRHVPAVAATGFTDCLLVCGTKSRESPQVRLSSHAQ
jgi:hypothetical protein